MNFKCWEIIGNWKFEYDCISQSKKILTQNQNNQGGKVHFDYFGALYLCFPFQMANIFYLNSFSAVLNYAASWW